MVLSLVYVSSATHLLERGELLAILDTSRRNNARLGVTGMLLYRDGNLMQVLEGEEDVVTALYDRIGRDPRHTGLLTLVRDHQDEREFGDWSMAFRDLDDLAPESLPGYSDFLSSGLQPSALAADPGRAQRLLRSFRQTMR